MTNPDYIIEKYDPRADREAAFHGAHVFMEAFNDATGWLEETIDAAKAAVADELDDVRE